MFTLNNGLLIPSIGFGTYKLTEEKDEEVIVNALKCGYRYLDTASFYGNEEVVGRAARNSGVPREECMIASKMWKDEMGYENTLKAFHQSLERMKMDYLDVYLIHWPRIDSNDNEWQERVVDTWRAMEELYDAGLVRAIGVSNFLEHHLEVLLAKTKVLPMIDQVEFHPGYDQKELRVYCKEHNIRVQAWSPMGRTRVFENLLLRKIAEKYGVSIAVVCLSYALQNGVMPVPKSSSIERMMENLCEERITLTREEMSQIASMEQTGWSGLHPDRERTII